jgi:hypothetical protein
MKRVYFASKEDGLKLLKKAYLHDSDVCEGEFADWLVENIKENFDVANMSTTLIMETIQLFRQWAHERDELESETFIEICSEINLITKDGVEVNDFQDYVYFDFTPVAIGVRIGIEKLNPETNEMFLDLDKGILFA